MFSNKKEIIKDLLIFIFLTIYIFILMYFANPDHDLIWNYGFSLNFASGLSMYKDYNMVITPLYPFLCGLFMKLFGHNYLTFTIMNVFITTSFSFFLYKKYPKVCIPCIAFISFILRPSYNLFSLFFFFILYYLEENHKSDYIIGIFLGLIFLTKTSFLLLVLASIPYYKNPKKIGKRIVGFLFPVLLFLFYFLLNNSLYDFFNYVFLGLLDFSSKNTSFRIGSIVFIISCIYLILLYKKKKDNLLLYILLFQIMSYPIFNFIHVYFSSIPILFYLLKNIEGEYRKYLNYIFSVFLLCPLFAICLNFYVKDFEKGINQLEYKYIPVSYLEEIKEIESNIPDLENTYFIMYDAYYYKLLLDLPIGKYDLLLHGNLGLNGEEKVLNAFCHFDKKSYFLLNETYRGGQLSSKIDSYIRSHYQEIKRFSSFVLYTNQ